MNNLSYASFSQQKISPEERSELFKRAQSGDMAARERIILAYTPLAKKIAGQYEDNGVPFEDLVQEAFSGITHALNRYNMDMGVEFGAYAKFYIEKYVKQAILSQSGSTPIIYKEDFFLDMQKYLRILDDLTQKLMRAPSNKELADALHLTEAKIRKISQSLFTFIPESSLLQTDQSLNSPEDSVMEHVLDLSCLNISLTKREREVVSRRLGFTKSGVPESLSEIARDMGLSHETIRLTYHNVINRIQKAVADGGYTISTIQI